MRQDRMTGLAAKRLSRGISHPEISIVIPALNEADCIVETLCAVDRQARALVRAYEIILVDDGSTDDMLARARTLATSPAADHRPPVAEFRQEQAMMAGLAQARGMR